MNVEVNVQAPKTEQWIYYGKPMHKAQVAAGGGKLFYEWYDNKELKGDPVKEVPIHEMGLYRARLYEYKSTQIPADHNISFILHGPCMIYDSKRDEVKLAPWLYSYSMELHAVMRHCDVNTVHFYWINNRPAAGGEPFEVSIEEMTLIITRI